MGTQARLIVDAARVDHAGETLRGGLSPEVLEWGRDENVMPAGGPRYDLFVQNLGTELLVRGRLWQELRCVCSRCAETFTKVVEESDFTRSIEINDSSARVDLTEEIREAIILMFPAYPVCSETCKGLCPKCGKNLNTGPCGCPKGSEDRWAALDVFR